MKIFFKHEIVDIKGYKNIIINGNTIIIIYDEKVLTRQIEVSFESIKEAEDTFYLLADLLTKPQASDIIDLRGYTELEKENFHYKRRIRNYEKENESYLKKTNELIKQKETLDIQLNELIKERDEWHKKIELIQKQIRAKEAEHGLTVAELAEKEGGLSFFGKKKG